MKERLEGRQKDRKREGGGGGREGGREEELIGPTSNLFLIIEYGKTKGQHFCNLGLMCE